MKKFFQKSINILKSEYLWIILFALFFIFFTNIYPLILYDADDWTYVAQARSFMPIIGDWNPAKVLPETLMPLAGSISAFIVNIFVKDYVKSFMLVSSLLVSFFITIYIRSFYVLIESKFKLGKIKSSIVSLIFLAFHFIMFYSLEYNNEYLFYFHNVNCCYNYLMPNLICFTLVFNMITKEECGDYSMPKEYKIKSGIVALIYFLAIFSNLYCNIVISVYAGSKLLIEIIRKSKSKIKLNEFCKKNAKLILILGLWVISVLYELTGERALYGQDGNILELIVTCIKNLIYVIITYINKPLITISLVVLILSIITFIRKKIWKDTDLVELFEKIIICIFVIALYFILISSKVSTNNIFRTEALFGLYAYMLVILSLFICYLLKNFNIFNVFIVVLLAFLTIETNCAIPSYKINNSTQTPVEQVKKINSYILGEIIRADKEEKSTLQLYVPKYETTDNWPISTYYGERISNTLYRHKVISRKLIIDIIPDESINKKFLN